MLCSIKIVLPPKYFEERTNPKGALHKETANDATVFHSAVAVCVANQAPAKCPRFAENLLVRRTNDATQRLHNFQVAAASETFELRIQTNCKASPWQLDLTSMQHSQGSERIAWPYTSHTIKTSVLWLTLLISGNMVGRPFQQQHFLPEARSCWPKSPMLLVVTSNTQAFVWLSEPLKKSFSWAASLGGHMQTEELVCWYFFVSV